MPEGSAGGGRGSAWGRKGSGLGDGQEKTIQFDSKDNHSRPPPRSRRRTTTADTPEHRRTLRWTLGWTTCCHWTPGGPTCGCRQRTPDRRKKKTRKNTTENQFCRLGVGGASGVKLGLETLTAA